ncbi:MAG: hypothetical protein PVJ89_13755 [Planctomycetota bacterium]|jgi:hypothetical protein
MQLHTFSALALSAIAAVSATTEPSSAPVVDDLFPAASGAMEIALDAEGNGPSYLELISDYAALTGQYVTYSKATRELLAGTDVQLDRSMTIAAEGVQHTTEVLLAQAGLNLAIESVDGPQILRVRNVETEGRELRTATRNLDVDGADLARKHPAMLFSMVIPMPTTDARLLFNSIRSMITDPNTTQILPAGGSSGMIIVGHGDWVYETSQWLLSVEEQSKLKAAREQEAAKQQEAREAAAK